MSSKRPELVLVVFAVWWALVFLIIWPWIRLVDTQDLPLTLLSYLSGLIWWVILLWALHHLGFQLVGLFGRHVSTPPQEHYQPMVAILYTTCDDFNAESCRSCLTQDYEHFRIVICDDSETPHYRAQVDAFCAVAGDRCTLIRRPHKTGFKAGNLNYALETAVNEAWVLLVDADQILPANYLRSMVAHIPPQNGEVAFLQSGHRIALDDDSSIFQQVLAPEIALYYLRDLAARQSYGFVPLLGHGALVRRSAWGTIGQFAEVVSEDFAFSLRALRQKQRGVYVREVIAFEAMPVDFGGFVIRLRKFAGGTAELFRRELLPFLTSSASLTEKWDLWLQLLWYLLMPLVVLNGFLGAYVTHRLWVDRIPYLHPVLPFIYLWLVLVLMALKVSASRGWWTALRFYFWSTAIYTASMPVAGMSFIRHLVRRPHFERTPKNGDRTRLLRRDAIPMVALGIVALVCGVLWLSPFSPVLLGAGVAYVSFPLYGKLCTRSILGVLARVLIYVPGLMMLIALVTMWLWGRY
ncbi:MAG: glycosyltransferase [Anaerolineae bacterium]|nr:glycosyltransferase [Anaerolineae bacterium]